MDELELKKIWEDEEKIAYIHGWDFSHIEGKYEIEDLPWDYLTIVKKYLSTDMHLLDYDTGGGEVLLSLNHPFDKTSATEGYFPNVALCENILIPLGINFKSCDNPSQIPFEDACFDIIINRHGSFDPNEIYRLLKPNGLFITQQVGCDNDRELVEMVLPEIEQPFPTLNLKTQRKEFEKSGFEIIESDEAYKPIRFFDVGAFVWFARIIQWEFIDFSVDKCFKKLLEMKKIIDQKGCIEGSVPRYMMVVRK